MRRLFPLLAACGLASVAPAADPFVAEFMASNQTGITDEDGSRADWIEIYNPGPGSVELAGWQLSDDAAEPGKWTFPAVTLNPGGTLLVWASGKDRRIPGAPLHTNFSLAKGGEDIVLSRADGSIADQRFVGYPAQFDNTSYGVTSAVETLVLLETGAQAQYRVPSAEISGWREVTFNPSGWSSGPQGIGYGSSFASYVGSNVQSVMRNVNPSIYVRLPFSVTNAAAITSLSVRTEYDDGFITYLNGTQVDAVGAPATPGWNSLSTDYYGTGAPRVKTAAPAATLLREGANVVAVHGMNQSLNSGDFIARIRVTGTRPAAGGIEVGFFAAATPNSPNGGTDTLALPQTVTFSAASGTFSNNFTLTISGALAGEVIRYTTDGSVPVSTSTAGTSLAVTGSLTLRARVFTSDGRQAGPVATLQLVKLAAYAQSFTSNLPLILLDSRGQSMSDSVARDVHFHLYDRDAGGVARLSGPVAVSSRSGVKIRGSSSAGYPKKPYGVELRDELGFDEDHALLDLGAESDWVLLAPYTFDRAYIHDAFINELSRRLGQWASRVRFVEVFFNQDGNDLDSNDYIGVYALVQKIKPGPDRLDIVEMELADLQPPNITGGYIFKVDRVDPGEYSWLTSRGIPNNTPGYTRSQWFVHVYPEGDDSLPAQRAWLEAEVQAVEDALYTANWAAFHARADAGSWIDHHILNVLAKNADAFRLSGFWHKDRLGKVKAGPLWDFDRSCESDDSRDDAASGWHPTGDGTPYFNYDWWKQWFETSADARQLWVDRWQEQRRAGGAFANATINAVLAAFQSEIGTAAPPRNTTRWPLTPPRADYDGNGTLNHADEIYHMRDWLLQRAGWIDAQFVAAPQFSRATGVVPVNTTVSLSGPAGATIYYTTDGSDPRAPGGGVAATARAASGPVVVAADMKLTARSQHPAWSGRLGDNAGNTVPWSSASSAVYLVTAGFAGSVNLAVSEVHYHPLDPSEDELGALPFAVAGDFEFIELRNTGAAPVSLAGVSFDEGAPGAALRLDHHVVPVGGHALVVRDRIAFELRHRSGLAAQIAGSFPAGNLADDGEAITLRDRGGALIASFAYDDDGSWPGRADGHGSSLEFTGGAPGGGGYADLPYWRASSEVEGSPGRAGLGPDERVVVNEVLSRTAEPFVDAIELANRSSAPVDLSGWCLGDRGDPRSADDFRLYRIPDGTVLAPGAHLAFDERDFNPNGPWNPAAGNQTANEFALDGVYGDDVWLVEAEPTGGRLVRFADHAEFGTALPGVSLGRFPDLHGGIVPLAAQTLADPAATTTPAAKAPASNSLPRVGPVVIHEILYQPVAPDDPGFEFVELLNTGGLSEPLDRWTLRGAVDFDFGPAHSLAPGATLVLVGFDPANGTDANAFRARFGVPAGVPLVGPWQLGGVLPNDAGLVRLRRAEASPPADPTYVPRIVEDESNYSALPPWPAAAGNGAALRRLPPAGWGNDPASWEADAPDPGRVLLVWSAWAALHLAGTAADDPGDDADGDGLENLVEFALGSDPRVPDARPPVQAAPLAGAVAFHWRRRLDRAVTVLPQHATDLLNWQDAVAFDTVTGTAAGVEEHRTVLPIDRPARFFRLRFVAGE